MANDCIKAQKRKIHKGDDEMMRRQIVKWLMLMAVALVAMMTSADMPRPSYHALPRSAWEAKIGMLEREKRETERQEFLEKKGIWEVKRKLDQNSRLGGWIVFLSPLVFGSIVVVCLLRYIRLGGRKYVIAMALAVGPLSMSIFLFWLNWYEPSGINVAAKYLQQDIKAQSEDISRDITVEPELGETYNQYLERVREYEHPTGKCCRCGKMTSNMRYSGGRFFICYGCEEKWIEERERNKN